jgi:hypothetical protein
MKQPHSRLLDLAAKRHLAPMGLIRLGRSRIWLDDRRWYAIVVEFQPSGFRKGSYLNVGAHFLWQTSGHLSFDLGYLVESFVQFESEAQFAPEADRLAAAAATEVGRLKSVLVGVLAVANSLPPESDGWASYHRAIALGLCGVVVEASPIFARLGHPSDPLPWQAELATRCLELKSLLTKPTEFHSGIVRMIKQYRSALGLPQISEPLTHSDLLVSS